MSNNGRYFDCNLPGPKIAFAYGAFSPERTGVPDKDTMEALETQAMIATASYEMDAMWAAMGDEVEIDVSLGTVDKPVKIVTRKREGPYPFGSVSHLRKRAWHLDEITDEDVEDLVYESVRERKNTMMDPLKSAATQRVAKSKGIRAMIHEQIRSRMFDAIWLMHRNFITRPHLAKVLGCTNQELNRIFEMLACLGMVIYTRRVMVRRKTSKKVDYRDVLIIGGWGIIDKNVFLRGMRNYGIDAFDCSRVKITDRDKRRLELMDEIHKMSVGVRSELDGGFAYEMDKLGAERNKFVDPNAKWIPFAHRRHMLAKGWATDKFIEPDIKNIDKRKPKRSRKRKEAEASSPDAPPVNPSEPTEG